MAADGSAAAAVSEAMLEGGEDAVKLAGGRSVAVPASAQDRTVLAALSAEQRNRVWLTTSHVKARLLRAEALWDFQPSTFRLWALRWRVRIVHHQSMLADSTSQTIAADDFARRFSMRGSALMWFLGAGASAAAGIPTASEMIAGFKQQLYVSQRRVSPATVADQSNPAVRALLQDFIDGLGHLPKLGHPEEYAALFEAVYADEGDRQTFLRGKMSGAKPSYGHIALATLMKGNKTNIVWTTNFDPLIADACAKVYDGTGPLTSVNLDAPTIGRQALNAQRWPIEIKLHGDFRSRRLKNTTDELRQQDSELRELLHDAFGRHGIVVVGYSGRDDSIMDTFERALKQSTPFPTGLFWLHRGEAAPLPRVVQLLEAAAASGVDGGLVIVENFDETLRDLVRLLDGLDMTTLDRFSKDRQIWSEATKPSGQRVYPAIRLNGIEIVTLPSSCRLIRCAIGGTAEVAAAVVEADVKILAVRSKSGVLAFGSDVNCRAAFARFGIEAFDLHTIHQHRLRYDSQERGLLRRALSEALAKQYGLTLVRRRRGDLLAPCDTADVRWLPLARLVAGISGSVSGHAELRWREGISVRLEWADGRTWLLVEPSLMFSGIDETNRAAATDFARERTVRRYNGPLNDLVAFWTGLLAGSGSELRALDVSSGVDAVFTLGLETAYSPRVRA